MGGEEFFCHTQCLRPNKNNLNCRAFQKRYNQLPYKDVCKVTPSLGYHTLMRFKHFSTMVEEADKARFISAKTMSEIKLLYQRTS